MPEPVNNEQLAPDSSGRGGLRALDLADPKDMGTLHRALQLWPARFRAMTAEARDEITRGVLDAASQSRANLDSDDPEKKAHAVDSLTKIASVMVRMEAIEQTERMAVLDRLAPKPSATPAGGGGSGGPPIINVQVVNVQQEPR